MKSKCQYLTELPDDAVEIPGYPKHYATPAGRLFARFGRIKQRRFSVNSCGYPICGLKRADGKRVFVMVHRIIAQMFVTGDHTLTVNHIDMDKANCAASNLEWVTFSDNHRKGRAMNPEWNNGLCSKALIAINPETKEERRFESGKAAALWVGSSYAAGNISKASVHGRVAYGFIWRKE